MDKESPDQYDCDIYVHPTGNCVYHENEEPYVSSYDSVKRQLTFFMLNGEWTRYTFDENKEIIKSEDSSGTWFKRDCDELGRELYFENSDGHWRQRKYDKYGNEIYFERDDGYWCERKYDSEGNEYYFKDSESQYQ